MGPQMNADEKTNLRKSVSYYSAKQRFAAKHESADKPMRLARVSTGAPSLGIGH